MRYNVVIYAADDTPINVLLGEEEVLTHDVPALMPPGGTWRVVSDCRLVKFAPALADVIKPEEAPR